MTINTNRVRQHIQNFRFEDLFIDELGWDVYRGKLDIFVDGAPVTLTAIAEKRGMVALTLGMIPDHAGRRKIEHQVARTHRENIIVYIDPQHTQQIWQWVRRETGKPLANRERRFYKGQTGEHIAQALQAIAFDLAEEDNLTIVDVTSRVRAAFDVERVTKRFYDRFKKQHDTFLQFIEGIPDEDFERWYASVMLNRLMFIYFVQKKGFLDNDPDYLRNRLKRSTGNFYRDFLCPLFFEGFATRDHSPEIRRLLGDVPYLNGGLFLPHQIEERYGDAIQITDEAFATLFDFFDDYRWHLDERPLRADNEINPDVLGYIFEKYINQKQMGAYYTKEDITEYISKNTVIPFLFDEARKAVKIAFEGEHTVWDLLAENPDRYIYPAVRHGTELPLPDNIAVGLNDVRQRGDWNTPAPPEYALPTEIWRETVARRRRYEEVRDRLARGDIRQINDLITLNLDIQQYAQDVLDYTDSPDVIRAFWKAVNSVTVLDPTCGSGAFLFAALNILEPLYDACLERMEGYAAEVERANDSAGHKFSDFREVLERIGQHPNRRYFILKSIIINNLFGVDIMEEAVEICKLRLFLKLVAQVDDKRRVEPLPDIDFNIRAGNTLVGFATEAEFAGRLFARLVLPRIETLTGTVAQFRREQLRDDVPHAAMQALKASVKHVLAELNDVLDQNLMEDYGLSNLQPFRRSHRPFHWFVEFNGVLAKGGFDVIIGNPPYVEYSKVRQEYSIRNYVTETCGNLYAYVMERALKLTYNGGRSGLIVLVGSLCTKRMTALQEIYLKKCDTLYLSSYSGHTCPGVLFEGAANRYAIWLSRNGELPIQVYNTRYLKWYSSERPLLFFTLSYLDARHRKFIDFTSPKVGNRLLEGIWNKVKSVEGKLVTSLRGKEEIWIYTTPIHWVKAFDFIPFFKGGGKTKSTQVKSLSVNPSHKDAIVCILNSSLFFLWWILRSDCYHLVSREYEDFPVNMELLLRSAERQLSTLAHDLMVDFNDKSTIGQRNQKTTGLVEFQVIDPKLSKSIIDRIDRVLARHYGFTDEELDFIINYDIKYRMGDDLSGEEGEE